MWATVTLNIDGRTAYEREIWLTCARGCSAKAMRKKAIEEAVHLVKSRCRGQLETCDSYEVYVNIESSVR